jgi:hypothetical protein
MKPAMLAALLLLASANAAANQWSLSPAAVAVKRATISIEITLMYTPSAGASAAEADVTLPLDHIGFAQVLAAPSGANQQVSCQLVGGRARALVMHTGGGALPVQPIPLCRIRVRPHNDTAVTTFPMTIVNAVVMDSLGNPLPSQATNGAISVKF